MECNSSTLETGSEIERKQKPLVQKTVGKNYNGGRNIWLHNQMHASFLIMKDINKWGALMMSVVPAGHLPGHLDQ